METYSESQGLLQVDGHHIFLDRVNNLRGEYCEDAHKIADLMRLEVDDYTPAEGEEFDGEKWESRLTTIFFLPKRELWKLAYSAARILRRGQNCYLEIADKGVCIETASVTVLS